MFQPPFESMNRKELKKLQLQFIKDFNVTAIASYPLRLIEVAKQEKFDFRSTKLQVGIFGA
jgi:phenylacetate-CoA ligase